MLDLKKLEQQLDQALATETQDSYVKWLLNNRLEQMIAAIHCDNAKDRLNDAGHRVLQIAEVLGVGEQKTMNEVQVSFEVPCFSNPETGNNIPTLNFCSEAA